MGTDDDTQERQTQLGDYGFAFSLGRRHLQSLFSIVTGSQGATTRRFRKEDVSKTIRYRSRSPHRLANSAVCPQFSANFPSWISVHVRRNRMGRFWNCYSYNGKIRGQVTDPVRLCELPWPAPIFGRAV